MLSAGSEWSQQFWAKGLGGVIGEESTFLCVGLADFVSRFPLHWTDSLGTESFKTF